MSKVLISFLGTGPRREDGTALDYREATYQFTSGHQYKTPFVAAAIKKEFRTDKVILIGTMRSMWECVYNYFAGERTNQAIWEELYLQREVSNHTTPISEIAHQQEVESVLGNGSKIIITHYGLTEEEIRHNSEIILGLEQYLNKGDELIIDITHAFRSLPMYIMNLLIYLQNVSEKQLKIEKICYGMLDVQSEYEDRHTPIVELNNIIEVNEWISGAYSFKRFGNADKIAELVRPIDNALSRNLLTFSDTKNLNHLAELERQCASLGQILNNSNLPLMAGIVIQPVIADFVRRLSVDRTGDYKHSKFQSKLARWQFNNKNYLAAYISLTESIITYLAEDYSRDMGLDIDVFDKDERDVIKDKIKNRNELSIAKEWKVLYADVSYKRNALAHNLRIDGVGRRNNNVTETFVVSLRNFLGRYDQLTNGNR